MVDLSFNLASEQNLWDLEGNGPAGHRQEQSSDSSKCPAPSKLAGPLSNSRSVYLSSHSSAFCYPEKLSAETDESQISIHYK